MENNRLMVIRSIPRTPADRRWLSLFVLCAGFLLIVVDATIVNVALPSIRRDLGFSESSLAWVVNAYLIAYGGLLLLAGRLGDLLGRRGIFLAGLALFTAASVLCGLSFSQPMLIAARFIQGVGGAVSSAVILAMIVTMFPAPAEQARAFGLFSVVASAGAAIGLLAGGFITQAVSWHWIFFVNLPLGVATCLLAWKLVEPDRGLGLAEGADVLGAALVTAALMLAVYTIVDSSNYGLGSAHTVGFAAVAVALLAAFVARQFTARKPILPLRLFRSRTLTAANLVQTWMVAGFFAFFFLGSLDLERVLGYGPLAIGLAFLPVAVAMGGLSVRTSAWLITRFGARRVLLVGQALVGLGLLGMAIAPEQSDYLRDLFLPMVLLGVGGGLAFPALTMIAMSGAEPADSGVASGLLNTTAQVGGALGLAVLATVASGRTGVLMVSGQDAASALSGGFHMAWAIGAGLVAVAIAMSATLLRPEVAAADQLEQEQAVA